MVIVGTQIEFVCVDQGNLSSFLQEGLGNKVYECLVDSIIIITLPLTLPPFTHYFKYNSSSQKKAIFTYKNIVTKTTTKINNITISTTPTHSAPLYAYYYNYSHFIIRCNGGGNKDPKLD